MILPARGKADLVLALHFAVVVYALFGAFLTRPFVWTLALHLPVVLWSSLVNLAGWTCPLTPLEQRWQQQARGESYAGSFIEHYLQPLVYPGGMPRRFELIAGVSVLVWNGLLYGVLYG